MLSLETSRSASSTRECTDCPHTSVTAPHAATIATGRTDPRALRASASEPIATTQSAGYHAGNAPGASMNGGARIAATAAMPGAIQSGNPLRSPSAACPAVAPAISTDTDARKSVDSQASHIAAVSYTHLRAHE